MKKKKNRAAFISGIFTQQLVCVFGALFPHMPLYMFTYIYMYVYIYTCVCVCVYRYWWVPLFAPSQLTHCLCAQLKTQQ